jgi:formylglycine-generating enzyme required for sulfatase activity
MLTSSKTRKLLLVGILSFGLWSCAGPHISAADKTWTNSIGMEFVPIPAGSFMMGTDIDMNDKTWARFGDERPRHPVTISKSFYLGKYEVTQEQWVAVMGSNPSRFKAPKNPVEYVSWTDVQRFIGLLNKKEGTNVYRLPTEAEWEYAARAGTTSAYFFGDDASSLDQYAWYKGNSDGKTHPVGQKQPNPWGLYDMHGNVREWVEDWYAKGYLRNPEIDPTGPPERVYKDDIHVLRGGSYREEDVKSFRTATRHAYTTTHSSDNHGFRLVRSHDYP